MEKEKIPTIVWYKIPVIKDDIIYTQKIPLKEYNNQDDADFMTTCTPLSYAGTVGWSYKEEFDKFYKDKLIKIG